MANPNISKHSQKTQFKKGQSGNPQGRPKGSKNWRTIASEMLLDPEFTFEMIQNGKKVKLKYPAEAIVLVMIKKACSGEVRAAEWLRKLLYGNGNPPPDPYEKERQMEEWFEETFPSKSIDEQEREMADWYEFEAWREEKYKKDAVPEAKKSELQSSA